MTRPRSIRALRKSILEAGLEIVSGTKHDAVVDPGRGGRRVATLPRSPSDHRNIPNTWADVRRYLKAREGE